VEQPLLGDVLSCTAAADAPHAHEVTVHPPDRLMSVTGAQDLRADSPPQRCALDRLHHHVHLDLHEATTERLLSVTAAQGLEACERPEKIQLTECIRRI
jgi:hypothetical protein